MSSPRYAALAARLLGGSELRYVPTAEDRERSLASIERALDAPRRRRRRRTGVLVAAAACALAWVGVQELRHAGSGASLEQVAVVASPLGDGARFLDSTGEVPLGPLVTLPVGGRIATAPGGGARLQLSTGTRLELESASILTLEARDALQHFALGQGALVASVAKLGPSERFVIDTPDARVEVRGTNFRLRVLPAPGACGDDSRTRLEVREGVVEVRAEGRLARVAAGQSWPADCAREAEASGRSRAPESPAVSVPEPGAIRDRVSSASSLKKPRTLPRSPIAAQSDLFAQGVRAQRGGDAESALRAYADLLERYPKSPLAENARAERMRLLAVSDAAQAKREAIRYLEQYPNGFARVEAERLAEGR